MSLQRAIGCMIGAAYGDSLGAAVEFMSLREIRKCYGHKGITQCAPAFGQPAGAITDDTQMAIATARGILNVAPCKLGSAERRTRSVWKSYLTWLASQNQEKLRRAPGLTCLSALQSKRMGTPLWPLNDSSGCGAVMRVHPLGILFSSNPQLAFQCGTESGTITHGHPNGYIPAGALAMLIAILLGGRSFEEGCESMVETLQSDGNASRGVLRAVEQALTAPSQGDHGRIIDVRVGQTGKHPGGWLGHDALAIAIYASRCGSHSPLEAVHIAVNHSGDSDSTGSIAGAIMGSLYGPDDFYEALRRSRIELEHRFELEDLARRLWMTSRRLNDSTFSWIDCYLWLRRATAGWRERLVP